MKEHDPIKNAARREQRRRKLPPHVVCVLCGEGADEALTIKNAPWLEAHHVVNAANDPDWTVCLCMNCHRKVQEDSRRVGASTAPPLSWIERLVAMLRAVGAFLVRAGEKMIEWADRLVRFVHALDARDPSWRAMPEAL